jgi:hypothetical protein
MLPELAQKLANLHVAGPRYVEPASYYAFWYSPLSVVNKDKKVYDGNGFDPVLKNITEPPYHLCTLMDPNAFKWPPCPERIVAKDITMRCPDVRTCGLFKFSVYDLADCGQDLPYFRRQITMMDRILKAGGSYEIEKIGDLYDNFERMEIYPPLVREMILPLVEELELINFAVIKDGIITITDAGAARVERFKAETTPDVIKALKL